MASLKEDFTDCFQKWNGHRNVWSSKKSLLKRCKALLPSTGYLFFILNSCLLSGQILYNWRTTLWRQIKQFIGCNKSHVILILRSIFLITVGGYSIWNVIKSNNYWLQVKATVRSWISRELIQSANQQSDGLVKQPIRITHKLTNRYWANKHAVKNLTSFNLDSFPS